MQRTQLALLLLLCTLFSGDTCNGFLCCQGRGGASWRRSKRYIGQFGDMIRLSTQREALLYNSYGNHCGLGGGDKPVVDAVDQCCREHDLCYDRANSGVCSWSWLGAFFLTYTWDWNGEQIRCYDEDMCRKAVCMCDKIAAECFAQHPYNHQHKRKSIFDWFA